MINNFGVVLLLGCVSSVGFAGNEGGQPNIMSVSKKLESIDLDKSRLLVSPAEMNDLFENYREIDSITLEDGSQVAPVARLEDLLGRRSLLTKDLEGRLIELKEQAD